MKICLLEKKGIHSSGLLKISGKAKVWNRTARDSPFHEAHMDSFAYKRAQAGIFFTNVNPFINLARSAGEGHYKR